MIELFRRGLVIVSLALLFVWTPHSTALGTDEARVEAADFVLRIPAGWRRRPPGSSFRLAEFAVPGQAGSGEGYAVIYVFKPGAGSGIEANLERWRRQFSDGPPAQIEDFAEAGRALPLFEAEGTFLAGPSGGAKRRVPGHAFIGGILQSAAGRVFVRFIAPIALARAEHDGVRTMLLNALGGGR